MRLALALFVTAAALMLVTIAVVISRQEAGQNEATDSVPCPTTYRINGCPPPKETPTP